MAPKKGGGGGQKKKKAVVSNRGFATVSVPRKKEVVEEVEEEVKRVEEVVVEREEVQGREDEWDPEAAEREELQSVAERIRPGSDKEAARVGKVRCTTGWGARG